MNSRMKMIYDIESSIEYDVEQVINESNGVSTKKYKIKGVFATIGEKNRNGRIYPRALWENAVNSYQSNFQEGSINLLMEWEHPPRAVVDPMEAVARMEKLYIKDKYVIGEAFLLNNDKANQLKSLIDAGIKISVSSRSLGRVSNGVVDDFKLITFDVVATPSDYNATMNGMVESFVLTEGILQGKEFEVQGNNIKEFISCTVDTNGNKVCKLINEKFDTMSQEVKDEITTATLVKFHDLITEMLSGNVLPAQSPVSTNSKQFKCTFKFKDSKTSKERKITLYFSSEEDAKTYAELKHYTIV